MGPDQGADLTRDQVAAVLRRAAELDRTDERLVTGPDLVERSIVEEAAVEAGLSRAAVRRALGELDVMPLVPPEGRHRNDLVTTIRSVPGPVPEVRTLVERSLLRRVLVRQRMSADGSRWGPRHGLWGTVRRRFGSNERRGLRGVRRVDVQVVADRVDDDRAVVRLDLDVRNLRHRETARQVGGVAAGSAVVAAMVGTGGAEMLLLAAPLGGGLAGGVLVGSRLATRASMERIHLAAEGLLDRVEHRGQDRSLVRRVHRSTADATPPTNDPS